MRAASRALTTAGNSSAAKATMIAITTSISTSVKPCRQAWPSPTASRAFRASCDATWDFPSIKTRGDSDAGGARMAPAQMRIGAVPTAWGPTAKAIAVPRRGESDKSFALGRVTTFCPAPREVGTDR